MKHYRAVDKVDATIDFILSKLGIIEAITFC